MSKTLPLLCFALLIDGFTFFIGLAISIIAATPGTFIGCAVGAAAAGKAGCAVLGLLGSIPLINGPLATLTEPIGIVLAFTITVAINCTFGAMIIFFLINFNMFNGRVVLGCALGEALPGISMLPLWTGMVWGCARATSQVGGVSGAVVDSLVKATSGFNLSNISKINPNIGGAMQGGQRVAATQTAKVMVGSRFSDAERQRLDESADLALEKVEGSFYESVDRAKQEVDRIKTNVNRDIRPRGGGEYAREIPA